MPQRRISKSPLFQHFQKHTAPKISLAVCFLRDTNILAVFLLCFAFRIVAYFILRTDQSVIGKAFVHKLIGIVILFLFCRALRYSFCDIGFSAKGAAHNALWGLLLGASVFFVAYGAEYIIMFAAGEAPKLQFFVTSYAIQGNRAMQTGVPYIIICFVGNLINVVMEEGLFRGLFVRVLESKKGFLFALMVSSLFFVLWHITQPIRNFLDGEQSLPGAILAGLILIITSTLMGIPMCLLAKITGSLWASLAAHFVNNTTVNLLHITTANAVDSMQAVRITIAQTLSFFIVLAIFLLKKSSNRETCRTI